MMWKLIGHDTFEGVDYDLGIERDTQEEIEEAARERLAGLERTQPSSSSGGQDFGGIQDRVIIQRPDGTRYRFTG